MTIQINTLQSFIDSWREIADLDSPIHRLRSFVQSHHDLAPTRAPRAQHEFDTASPTHALASLREPLERQRRDGAFLNPGRCQGRPACKWVRRNEMNPVRDALALVVRSKPLLDKLIKEAQAAA